MRNYNPIIFYTIYYRKDSHSSKLPTPRSTSVPTTTATGKDDHSSATTSSIPSKLPTPRNRSDTGGNKPTTAINPTSIGDQSSKIPKKLPTPRGSILPNTSTNNKTATTATTIPSSKIPSVAATSNSNNNSSHSSRNVSPQTSTSEALSPNSQPLLVTQ